MRRGFTLAELLTIVAILAICAAIILPAVMRSGNISAEQVIQERLQYNQQLDRRDPNPSELWSARKGYLTKLADYAYNQTRGGHGTDRRAQAKELKKLLERRQSLMEQGADTKVVDQTIDSLQLLLEEQFLPRTNR